MNCTGLGDGKCLELQEQLRKCLTDLWVRELIQRSSGCENAAEIQELAREKRDAAPAPALNGVSIRHALRLAEHGGSSSMF